MLVDAACVVKGFRQTVRHANGDLWSDIDQAAAGREVEVIKVKSHVTEQELVAQVAPVSYIVLNEMADLYAQKGARMAAVTLGMASKVALADQRAQLVIERLLAIGKHIFEKLPPPEVAEQTLKKKRQQEEKERRPKPEDGPHVVQRGRHIKCKLCKASWARGSWSSMVCDPTAALVKKVDATHSLRVHRGLLFCSVCGGTSALEAEGAKSSGMVKKLGKPCLGSTSFGLRVLGCLRRDRLPPGLLKWPTASGELCRLWS